MNKQPAHALVWRTSIHMRSLHDTIKHRLNSETWPNMPMPLRSDHVKPTTAMKAHRQNTQRPHGSFFSCVACRKQVTDSVPTATSPRHSGRIHFPSSVSGPTCAGGTS